MRKQSALNLSLMYMFLILDEGKETVNEEVYTRMYS